MHLTHLTHQALVLLAPLKHLIMPPTPVTRLTPHILLPSHSKVFAIAEDAALDDALVNEILATGYSRIPVFR